MSFSPGCRYPGIAQKVRPRNRPGTAGEKQLQPIAVEVVARRIRHRLFVEDESPAAFLEEPRKHGASQELPGRADTDVVTPTTGTRGRTAPRRTLDHDHEAV